MPNYGKVCFGGKVLCDSNSSVQVEDDVPPASRHKHCLTRILDGLHRLVSLRPVTLLGLGINNIKPCDGLIPLLTTFTGFDRNQLLGSVSRKETPSFVS